MNHDDKKKVYLAISGPFPAEAIERTDASVTGKGYSTTGIKYQFIANRLNEVLGVGGYRTEQSITVRMSTTAKGRTAFEAICDVTLQLGEWDDGAFRPFAEAHGTGGHTSTQEADAKKGAFSNGFKKAAAMLGCGRQAYEGSIDDDNVSNGIDDNAPHGNGRFPVRHIDVNRLTSAQSTALWALARKLNVDAAAFRARIKERFGVPIEGLDRSTASALISELSARLADGRERSTSTSEVA